MSMGGGFSGSKSSTKPVAVDMRTGGQRIMSTGMEDYMNLQAPGARVPVPDLNVPLQQGELSYIDWVNTLSQSPNMRSTVQGELVEGYETDPGGMWDEFMAPSYEEARRKAALGIKGELAGAGYYGSNLGKTMEESYRQSALAEGQAKGEFLYGETKEQRAARERARELSLNAMNVMGNEMYTAGDVERRAKETEVVGRLQQYLMGGEVETDQGMASVGVYSPYWQEKMKYLMGYSPFELGSRTESRSYSGSISTGS